ncbi:MAG: hypothetical protein WCZ66_10760 [Sphingomonadaceae bacterium]
MKIVRLLFLVALAFMPSRLKIAALRFRGAKVGKGCKIGFSILDAKNAELGDYVYIGNFNIVHNIDSLVLSSGSKIENFNWIAGGRVGRFFLGRNGSIRRFHFIEASGGVSIGNNSILAGRSSILFSHGRNSDGPIREAIEIGDWCQVGAASRFVPGAKVEYGTFVGMGSVVSKKFDDTYVLIAGNPATVKKSIDRNAPYFRRSFLRHTHHPASYIGK